jgi:sugar phosphate isomerase/epimerase
VTDDHLPPGEGLIDWRHVLSSLARVGYRGALMLEVAGDGDVVEHVSRAAASAKRLEDAS